MIKHHPTSDLLTAFVHGELPASVSAAIAIHTDMCPCCQEQIQQLNETAADLSFVAEPESVIGDNNEKGETINFDNMMANIMADESIVTSDVYTDKVLTIKHQEYILPRALNNMPIGKFTSVGKMARARIQLGEGDIHTSLLQLEQGGAIPEHTHNGYEITLLLAGSFEDEMGDYHAGDFIMLDGQHQHSPITQEGCLCLTVVSDALHFTKGINRLLNPFGALLY